MNIIQSLTYVKNNYIFDIKTIFGDFNLPDVNYNFPLSRRRDSTYDMFFAFFSD